MESSHKKETILVVVYSETLFSTQQQLKNTILRRKLFAETRSMLQENNPSINSKIIHKNPIPNLLFNETFANIYYLYFFNKVLLFQLLVNSLVSSLIMIYFNLE